MLRCADELYFNGVIVLTKSLSVTDLEDIVDGTASNMEHNIIQTNGELGARSVLKFSPSVLPTGGGVFGSIVLVRNTCNEMYTGNFLQKIDSSLYERETYLSIFETQGRLNMGFFKDEMRLGRHPLTSHSSGCEANEPPVIACTFR